MADRKRLRRHVLRGGAALAALLASVLHIPSSLSARRLAASTPPPVASRPAAGAAADGPRCSRRVAAHRQLRHRRHARSADAHAHRQRADHLAQPGRRRRLFDPPASVLERVPEHQLDVAEAAPPGRRRSVRRAPPRTTSVTPTSPGITIVNADGSDGADLTKALRFISPDDQNTDDRSLAAADAGRRRSSRARRCGCASTWTGRFPTQLRSHRRRSATTSSSRSGSRSSACSTPGWTAHQFFANSEFFSDFGSYDVRMTVPKGWMVGATGVEQSRDGDPSTTLGQADDASLRAGRRARLRVDDEPGLHREAAAVRHARPRAGADAAADPARARIPGRSPFRRRRRGAEVLRRVVRRAIRIRR